MSGEYTVHEGTCEIEPGDCGAVAEGLRCSPLSEARRGTAMINGTHVVVYSKDPESDREKNGQRAIKPIICLCRCMKCMPLPLKSNKTMNYPRYVRERDRKQSGTHCCGLNCSRGRPE